MRFFIMIVTCIVLLHAADKKQELTVGAGLYYQSQPYKDASALMIPSPVVFFDNGLFYVRWSRLGIYFLGDKQEDYAWGFSLTAQPRTLGYKASDATILTGMDERKSSLEGGLAFSAKYENYYIENMLLHDLLGYHKAWLNRTEIGAKYKFGKMAVYPSIILLYQSEKFMNYYYGVKQQESNPAIQRPYYHAGSAMEYGVQTYIKYPLTHNLSTLINLRYDVLPKSAKNSPLTQSNSIYSGLASIIYTFKY